MNYNYVLYRKDNLTLVFMAVSINLDSRRRGPILDWNTKFYKMPLYFSLKAKKFVHVKILIKLCIAGPCFENLAFNKSNINLCMERFGAAYSM